MSWMPPGYDEELSETVKKHKQMKETKRLEANELTTAEWQAELGKWRTHYKEQKQLSYDQRLPYYQDPENRIVIMGFQSKVKEDKDGRNLGPFKTNVSDKKPNSVYYDFFVSGLLSNLITEPKVVKEVTIYDSEGTKSIFEAWYLKQGKWISERRFLRGQFSIKYRDMGDDKDKYGSLPWVYAKKKGKEEIEDLDRTTYERLFTLNLWDSIPFPR